MANKNISPNDFLNSEKIKACDDPEKIFSSLKNSLPAEKQAEFMSLLQNKSAVEQLLKSEKAKQLMEKFGMK